jgi:inorganic pyrophosphatase
MDVCVLTEKSIGHGDLLMQAIPIGGLRMIDNNEADDKIIAVMRDDALYGQLSELAQCPSSVIERLRHYFLTYKHAPGSPEHKVEITHVYGRDEAYEVIRRSQADYVAAFMGAGMLR